MAISREIDRLSKERKYLRVSEPTGGQRSTFFLQLPYRFSIPLMITSGLLHWLWSQSVFLVSVSESNAEGKQERVDNVLGYSPMPFLVGVIILFGMVLASIIIGHFFKNEGIVPTVGSNSAAISAICHPPADDKAASKAPVMWGAIATKIDVSRIRENVEAMEITNTALPPASEAAILLTGGNEEAVVQDGTGHNLVGHCCLTSFPVTVPIEGCFYQ
ncbi:hypothetical protein ABW20_dc0102814 [Dactylellina cionopaga]|nr:hypothetical protein ABW20_dc0102814 [Dactylellina cionopaga]